MNETFQALVNLAATFLAVVGLAAALLTVATRLGRRACPWPTRAPVLGGGQPATHAWSRFHVRYAPMTLLFIAFEMEMMFMYPWAVVYVVEGVKAVVEMAMFLAILALGIVYAWREGALRWQ